MAGNPIRVPVPLSGEEIKQGLARMMVAKFTGGLARSAPVESGLAEAMEAAFMETLAKAGPLHHREFSTVSAKWIVEYVRSGGVLSGAKWVIDYSADDFGMKVEGQVGGSYGGPLDDGPDVCSTGGILPEMPPDKFRELTEQKIPEATVVKKAEPTTLYKSTAQRIRDRSRV